MSKICPRCGKPCDDSAAFCDNCGNRLGPAAQPAQNPKSNNAQAQSPQRGNYNDQYNQSQRRANVPQQNVRPAQGYNGAQAPAPQNQGRSNKGLIVAIVVSASVIFTVLVIILIVLLGSCSKQDLNPVVPTISVQTQPETTEESTTEAEPATEAPTTAKPTEKATEAPTTKAPTTEAPVVTEAPAVDYSNVGKPSDSDFSGWILRASEAGVPNSADLLYDKDDINGMWKCMFYYTMTNVRELKNVEILAGDRAATVNITNYQVYVNGAYQDDSTPKSVLEGAIDNGSVTAYGNSGSINLYAFYYNGGKEYAIGTYTNQSGETAFVGMVRP